MRGRAEGSELSQGLGASVDGLDQPAPGRFGAGPLATALSLKQGGGCGVRSLMQLPGPGQRFLQAGLFQRIKLCHLRAGFGRHSKPGLDLPHAWRVTALRVGRCLKAPETHTARFRFSETELAAASAPALSETQKAGSESDARSACEDLIRRSATIPTTVKIHSFLGTSVFKAPSTGNLVVTSDFDAKNAFGTEIGYQAKCYFKPGIATGTVEIQQRLK